MDKDDNKIIEDINLDFEILNNKIKLAMPKINISVKTLIESTKPLLETFSRISVSVKPLIENITNCVNYYRPYFKELSETLEKIRSNPDSIFNWYEYSKKMSEFFWIIPYKMEPSEIKKILETVNSEKDFDKYISQYFTKELIAQLNSDIYTNLPQKHKSLFKQIIRAFDMRCYSLANTGIMSIIDGLCSYYVSNKRCVKRLGIFEPIICDLEEKTGVEQIIFILMMLNANINVLYQNLDFNEEININTNKKVRRNPNQHGQAYSNKKIDTIMLLNTLYYLAITQKELRNYKSLLLYDKGKFYIPSDKERTKMKIKNNIKE